MSDFYYTIEKNAISEFVEKKSRFISEIRKTVTEEEARKFIEEKKKEFWNATHNVFAYVIKNEGIQRFSDDGEPQGTAGMPTLDVLTGRELEDVAVVVTRYFGGTLLGTGGLVRAYSKGAILAVEAAGIIKMQLCTHALVECDYPLYGRLSNLLPNEGAIITDTVYTDKVEVYFYFSADKFNRVQSQIIEASAGTVEIKALENKFERVND